MDIPLLNLLGNDLNYLLGGRVAYGFDQIVKGCFSVSP